MFLRHSAITLSLFVLAVQTSAQSLNPFAPTYQPDYKYPVTAEAGPWLICVQTFRGSHAQQMAEEMAEILRREYRVPSYLQDWGRKQREEQQQQTQKLRDQYHQIFAQMRGQGLELADNYRMRLPEMRIDDEFAVLIGKPNRLLKDMESARDYLNKVRKFKRMPDRYAQRVFTTGRGEGETRDDNRVGFVNPFATAMVVHNPTVAFEKEVDNPDNADRLLKTMNADEDLSLLRSRKRWTLVVKVYQGQMALLAPQQGPSIRKLFSTSSNKGETYLNACALQAHTTAEFLRKALHFEAFVLHHKTCSLVTVGEYDSIDDPRLKANQKTLAGLQFKDQATQQVKEMLMASPLPMKIPH